MERLTTIILAWLLIVSCAMQKESYSHREEIKRERAYDKNYDTIRYFDSTYVRTIETDSLREILRDRVILGERTVHEIHHDTLLRWQKDTVYIKEGTKEKEKAPHEGAKLCVIALILVAIFIIYRMRKKLP